MKNTYNTEIYHNLGLFRTKTGIKHLTHLKTENMHIFIIVNEKTITSVKYGNLYKCKQTLYP